jgi:hypothetical protein
MRIGVVFPQTELGGDASAVRAYGQHVEELGFTHLLAYDHVAGADPAVHDGSAGPYDLHTTFHEPLVMFGYLAAVTTTLSIMVGTGKGARAGILIRSAEALETRTDSTPSCWIRPGRSPPANPPYLQPASLPVKANKTIHSHRKNDLTAIHHQLRAPTRHWDHRRAVPHANPAGRCGFSTRVVA